MTHAGAKGNTGLQLENALHLTMFSHEKLWGVMGNLIRNVKVKNKTPTFVATWYWEILLEFKTANAQLLTIFALNL